MGVGDELIAAGVARRMQTLDMRKVRIVYRNSIVRWHDIWENNPRLATPGEQGDFQILRNGPGERPYIDGKLAEKWVWREWKCQRGEIYLKPEEMAFGAHYPNRIIVEPWIKRNASPNKDWGLQNWMRLGDLMRAAGMRITQLGPSNTRLLDGAELIVTDTFRQAAAVLANASACVLPEGGLHHAAAALRIPAVVIFGGFISPKQTGYADQINLFTGGKACGMRIKCSHCMKAMSLIEPESVFNHLEQLLGQHQGMARTLAS